MPAIPYRGIRPFRYVDHGIFFARDEETQRLASLVTVYRGVMLYGESGVGKSSLINAGLLAEATRLGFHPERLRVQPRPDEELVIERIASAGDDPGFLPSLLAPEDDSSSRIVLSTHVLEQRLRAACASNRPLIVFDQFEEIVTLFEEAGAGEARQRLVEVIVKLLRGTLPVKLLFSFREDYLGKVKQLLAVCPELVDQALLLTPPAADTLPTIIRGPFERYPGHFARELAPGLAERLRTALVERFSVGDLSLSEVQTVCLRLWQVDEPEALLEARGVQGLLEDYVGEELEAFPPDLRGAAIAVLGQMLTSAGTRNVMSAEDLIQRVREDDDMPPPLLREALERLESESRLVRRERRRDLYLYEITSEFLVPWIGARRDEFRRAQDRRRYRRRLRVLGSLAGVLVLLGAAVAWSAILQRGNTEQQLDAAESALAGANVIKVGSAPVGVVVAARSVWTSNQADGTISEVDPEARKQVNQIQLAPGLSDITAGFGSLWVANVRDNTVVRVAPGVNQPVGAPIALPGTPSALAPGGDGHMWVATKTAPAQMVAIDPPTGQPTESFPVPGSPADMQFAEGAFWVTSTSTRNITRVTLGGESSEISIGAASDGVAVGAGYLWVTNPGDDVVTRIDLGRPTLQKKIRVGRRPEGVAADDRSVWVVNQGDDSVTRIDAHDPDRTVRYIVGENPSTVALDDAGVAWVVNTGDNTLSRIKP